MKYQPDEQFRKHLNQQGIRGKRFKIDSEKHAEVFEQFRRWHPEETEEQLHERAAYFLIWKHRGKHNAKWYLKWLGAGLVLAGLLFFCSRAEAQVDTIQFQDSSGSVVKTFAAPFKIKAGSTVSFSQSGSTLTIAASGVAALTDNTASGGYLVDAGGFQATSIKMVALTTPSAPTVTCSGACAGGTWSYKVACYDANGAQTTASSAGSATNATTLTTTNKNTVTWTAVTNASSCAAYRTASAGTPANLSLLCTVNAGSAMSCVDDGSVNTASATAPTFNSTGTIQLAPCTFSSNDINLGLFPTGGISMGMHPGTGICADNSGNIWFLNGTHLPSMFLGSALTLKWSQNACWSPNGTFPNGGNGVCLAGSITSGFDTEPGMLVVGWNVSVGQTKSYVGAKGFSTQLTATAGLTAGQVVKIDTANPSSMVVATTSDTGPGAVIGFVMNSPTAGNLGFVMFDGTLSTPVLGTGTCAIGQFVIVDTTTNGRIQCTSSYLAGSVIGTALTAQASVGGTVTVLAGLTSSPSNIKHGRVTTGSIGAGLSAAVTLTWGGSAFADTSYTVNCSVLEATTSTSTIRVHHIESVTTSTAVVRLVNDDGSNARTGTLECNAFHD